MASCFVRFCTSLDIEYKSAVKESTLPFTDVSKSHPSRANFNVANMSFRKRKILAFFF